MKTMKTPPFADLMSLDADRAQAAVDAALEANDARWIRPLLEAFRDRPDDEVRTRIGEVLGTLKRSEGGAELAEALADPAYAAFRADIIGFMWSAGFLPETALRDVVEAGVEGDFRCALEAMTWVDQIEHVGDEAALLAAILCVRGALEDSGKQEIHPLLTPMLASLEALDRRN
jgi:hypothetical protein